MSYACVLRMR